MGLRFKTAASGMYTATRSVLPVLRLFEQEQERKGAG
jgi:hypothetical protein